MQIFCILFKLLAAQGFAPLDPYADGAELGLKRHRECRYSSQQPGNYTFDTNIGVYDYFYMSSPPTVIPWEAIRVL